MGLTFITRLSVTAANWIQNSENPTLSYFSLFYRLFLKSVWTDWVIKSHIMAPAETWNSKGMKKSQVNRILNSYFSTNREKKNHQLSQIPLWYEALSGSRTLRQFSIPSSRGCEFRKPLKWLNKRMHKPQAGIQVLADRKALESGLGNTTASPKGSII